MTNLVMKKNKNRGWFKKLPGGEFNKHQLFNRGEDFKHNAIMYIQGKTNVDSNVVLCIWEKEDKAQCKI